MFHGGGDNSCPGGVDAGFDLWVWARLISNEGSEKRMENGCRCDFDGFMSGVMGPQQFCDRGEKEKKSGGGKN